MKKIFSLVVAMVLSIGATVSAQSIQGELVLGLNIADVDASGASSRVGFNAGVRGTYAFQSQRKRRVCKRCYVAFAQRYES